eukprot:GFYU01002452.1.p1 GENE.GFYU01002452.1~~GFYU01002452.1.p1  ORF type:complete len:331 (+),score=42.58 GFYU01002452.1:539-1531(+)
MDGLTAGMDAVAVGGKESNERQHHSKQATSLNAYETLEQIGEGTYAVVYKARHKMSQDLLALKHIRITSDEEGIPCSALREIAILKDLRHPNVIRLKEVIANVQQGQLTLVFDYLDQDLRKYLDCFKQQLEIPRVKTLLHEILHGVAYIHRLRILHRDLKPQNILVSKEGKVKLADFGLARAAGIPIHRPTTDIVTLWYRPPEVLMGSAKYATAIDMWSVGCIFAEMVSGRAPFRGKNDVDQLLMIFRKKGTPTIESWPRMVELPTFKSSWPFPVFEGIPLFKLAPRLDDVGLDLLRSMLEFDPAKRITAHQALCHPYFNDVQPSSVLAQ